VPGKKPAVCHSLVELLDLYPTTARLCALDVPARLQGQDISVLLDDPAQRVRDAAFCANGKGTLLRDENWAFITYGARKGKKGSRIPAAMELYDIKRDPRQYTNLVDNPAYADTVRELQARMAAKLQAVRKNDLGLTY